MKVGIVDDCGSDSRELRAMLERYCAAKRLRVDCTVFSSAESLLAGFVPGVWDILFLDVFMGGMTGMDAARAIRAQEDGCRLVFLPPVTCTRWRATPCGPPTT